MEIENNIVIEPENIDKITETTELINVPTLKVLTFEDSENMKMYYDSNEILIEMFIAWVKYFGEVQNPNNTAINPFYKKADGTGTPYAPLSEVLNTVRPILSKYGFGLFQVPVAKTGQMSIKTILIHVSGGSISFPDFVIPVTKNDPQGLIAAETYARRGSLNAILGIQGEIDNDGNDLNNTKPTNKPETTKPTIPEDVVAKQKLLIALAKELIDGGTDREIVNSTLESSCQSKNPNSVKDIKLLDVAYTSLEKIRKDKKAVK